MNLNLNKEKLLKGLGSPDKKKREFTQPDKESKFARALTKKKKGTY